MNNCMVDFSKLPVEIINKIINYTDVVVYRYGKYMNRISKKDNRYGIINKRQLPLQIGINRWMFNFTFYNNNSKTMLIIHHIYNPHNKSHLISKKNIEYLNGIPFVKNQVVYIVDLHGKYHKIVHYTM